MHQYLTLFSASVCVGPAVIKSPFHATGSARTATGLFLLLVRRSGTHCPKTCGIRSVLWTVTDSHWRHFYFRSTSVFSALEVCYDNALYKFTFDIDTELMKNCTIWCMTRSQSSTHSDMTDETESQNTDNTYIVMRTFLEQITSCRTVSRLLFSIWG